MSRRDETWQVIDAFVIVVALLIAATLKPRLRTLTPVHLERHGGF